MSKVDCVGLQTQNKLLDIRAAAAAVGIHNLAVVHNCITTGARPLRAPGCSRAWEPAPQSAMHHARFDWCDPAKGLRMTVSGLFMKNPLRRPAGPPAR